MNYLSSVLALLLAVTGFAVAYFEYKSSDAGGADYTGLGTEPGTPEGRQNYHALANMQGATRLGRMNKRSAYWSAAGVLIGLVSSIAGLWLIVPN